MPALTVPTSSTLSSQSLSSPIAVPAPTGDDAATGSLAAPQSASSGGIPSTSASLGPSLTLLFTQPSPSPGAATTIPALAPIQQPSLAESPLEGTARRPSPSPAPPGRPLAALSALFMQQRHPLPQLPFTAADTAAGEAPSSARRPSAGGKASHGQAPLSEGTQTLADASSPPCILPPVSARTPIACPADLTPSQPLHSRHFPFFGALVLWACVVPSQLISRAVVLLSVHSPTTTMFDTRRQVLLAHILWMHCKRTTASFMALMHGLVTSCSLPRSRITCVLKSPLLPNGQ